ncbi:MAG TPA: hypothetical protein VMA83_03205 [Solirubrobacteraceae bacterium]|nr:hypothetical protein [Solirubrobacteraceae bacterium]
MAIGGMMKGIFKRTPWPLILTTLLALERRRRALDRSERARLMTLLAKTARRPRGLSREERGELRTLVARLDPVGAGHEVLPLVRHIRRRRAG